MSGARPEATEAHPRHRLDDVIHAPVRLSVVAALAAVERADFKEVRDAVEVSDSVLSKAVATLEAAGYVGVAKGRVGRRPRTWLTVTADGRRALADHLAALSAIAAGEALPSAAGAAPSSVTVPAASSRSSTTGDPAAPAPGNRAPARPPRRGARPSPSTAPCG